MKVNDIKRGELIEYEVENYIDCITPCPHKARGTITGGSMPMGKSPVGSNACRMCDHHVYDDKCDQNEITGKKEHFYGYVVCFYKENTKK